MSPIKEAASDATAAHDLGMPPETEQIHVASSKQKLVMTHNTMR